MQSRLVVMEEVNAPPLISTRNHPRVFRPKVLPYMWSFLLLGLLFSVVTMLAIWWFGGQNIVPVGGQSIALNCSRESLGLESWIRPRSSLMHSMSDSELLWRASFEPRRINYPFKRTPKIAFLFLTRGPLPMAPLWERFFHGQDKYYSIFIHSLPSYQPDFSPSSVFYRRQIPSQMTEWGQISLCDAERRLLANALLDISNERFVLLSEACIPLRNFSVVYSYIMDSQYSFVGAVDEPGRFGRGRYNQSMAPLVNLTQWRKGWQWFEVNRKLALDIVEDSVFYPKFKKYCRPEVSGCFSDEHYFPTMLTMKYPHLLANRSLTWVDWSRGHDYHPTTFEKGDITRTFFKKIKHGMCFYNGKPSSVCHLFARKFDQMTLERLLIKSSKYLGF